MQDFDGATPEQHKARYEALRRDAIRSSAQADPCASPAFPPPSDCVAETIPGGWYASLRLRRGWFLRLSAPAGRASVATLLWNAQDVSERLNVGDSMKIQWRADLGAGRLLYSDMGRPLTSIVADSGVGHDALVGCSDPATILARYGDATLRNGRDNLRLAAAKLGLERRDVMPCFTFFAPIAVDADGAFHWRSPDAPQPEAFVTMRAEMDLLVALSTAPHPLDPHADYAPGPIVTQVWQGPAPLANDLCRMASPEARRAFEALDDAV